ncbi:DUF2637 domain-containing protein [Rhodococcus hoagii]|nr:DUF2637 domain-containing protein [Prescottella equi]
MLMKLSAVRPKMVALAGVAVMTLVLAALAFTLSFDSLRALAIEIGARPERAWMAPVAIDIAQAAATLGLVAVGVSDRYNHARWYCMGLATLTVALSVAGNSYHAYGLAQQNIARVAAGVDIGFIPQPPVIAAIIASIWPLLYLALLHLGTTMLRVIMDERAQLTVIATATDLHSDAIATAPSQDAIATGRGKDTTSKSDDATATAKRNRNDAPAATKTLAVVPTPDPVAQREVTATQPAAANPSVAPADETNAATADATVAASGTADVGAVRQTEVDATATKNGYPQTTAGLRKFLEENKFSEATTEVAAMLIEEEGLMQIDVAQRLRVDKSTVSRRWKPFVTAAKEEGFTVPPLPRLTDVSEPVRELQPA